jgi:hypothetical protein
MKLHHIGYIVEDIEAYQSRLIYECKTAEVVDPVQNARLALFSNFTDSFIELIQPLSEGSFTYNALQKAGNSYHHLCYSVGSKDEFNDIAKKYNLVLIKDWLPALLFGGKSVCFCYTRNKSIVEFLLEEE